MYVPGVIWLEVAALLMRETRGPAGVLPSIPMLVITVAVLAFGLPRAWAGVAALERAASESMSGGGPDSIDADGNNTHEPAAVRLANGLRSILIAARAAGAASASTTAHPARRPLPLRRSR